MRSWPDQFRHALARQPLPSSYRQRLVDEVLDHYRDLMEENPDMSNQVIESRLGSAQTLATQASAEFAARSFGGRHPVWMFLVAPIPAVLLLLALGIGGVAVAVEYTPASWANFITRSNGQELLLEVGSWVARILPFAVIAHLFGRAAVRSGRSGLWGLVAGALVSVIALSFAVHYRLPTGGPGTGMVSVGLGFPPTGTQQWLQCLVPMGIVLGHLVPNARPFRSHEVLA